MVAKLQNYILALREIAKKSMLKNEPQNYTACWTEDEILDGSCAEALVIILRTSGCRWALGATGGCTMCGYINDAAQTVTQKDLLNQFENAISYLNKQCVVKIYTSGSFLDENEIPMEVSRYILKKLAEKVEKIVLETRPEFVTTDKLSHLKDFPVELAIGLESANNEILRYSINKGFRVEDYVRAAQRAAEFNIPTRTYILVKPPFVSEYNAFVDACQTARFAANYSKVLSFNPVNVQKYTLVEYLWRRGEYRPPWLWTVLKILNNAADLKKECNLNIVCTIPGTSNRTAHNCGKCDRKIVNAIRRFSQTQDKKFIEHLACTCQHEWQIKFEMQKYPVV